MDDILPTKFELAQNYPNPFREKTTIKYCIPEKMKIRLEVFDSKGNKVRTLVDDIKEAGTHKVEFNLKNIEGGEYFYKLESKDYFETKQMLMMK